MSIEELLDLLWADYVAITPAAARVRELLAERGERMVHDHVALRTFSLPGCDIEDLDRAFVAAGYEPADSYQVPGDHLEVCYYEHERPGLPKIVISAVDVGALSDVAGAAIRALVAQVPEGAAADPMFAVSGRVWDIDGATWRALAAESAHAAWVAAFGFRAHRFAALVNALATVDSIAELAAVLGAGGVALGPIEGGAAELFEQVATAPEPIELELSDGVVTTAGCQLGFVRRYPGPDGELFEGFR